jgi:hypothetical protein
MFLDRRSRRADEDGAAAIVAVLIALLCFCFAALAIDLGNAVSRAGDTQVQADFAALAGGQELPGAKAAGNPAVVEAATYLLDNAPADDRVSPWVTSTTRSAQVAEMANHLVDGSDDNGEVYFTNSTTMRVLSPASQVNFGFAGIFGMFGNNVPNSVQVGNDATVALRSPGILLPFFLPQNCTGSAVELKTDAPGGGSNNVAYDPASTNSGTPRINRIDPILFPGGVTSTMTFESDGPPDPRFESTMEADFFYEAASDGSDRVPVDKTQGLPVTVTSTGMTARATVDLPPGVFNRPGIWHVRLKNSSGWSAQYGRFEVGDPIPPPEGCGVSATGDFGYLDSPRKSDTMQPVASRKNIALGLDHLIVPFTAALPSATQQDSCRTTGNTPIAGAVLDTDPNRDDANCVEILNGNEADMITDGLILGGSDYDGLLDADTTEGCDPTGGSAEKSRLGVNTNDDVLSCFLTGSTTVGDVMRATLPAGVEHSIDSDIFNSPRFAVVPIIHYEFNPPNGFYPVVDYQPVFITGESTTSSNGSSYTPSTNGVILGSSKVESLRAIPINPDALPETVSDYSGEGMPWIGSGTKLVRMID